MPIGLGQLSCHPLKSGPIYDQRGEALLELFRGRPSFAIRCGRSEPPNARLIAGATSITLPNGGAFNQMANFRTHIGFSTFLGCGYAGLGYAVGAPAESAILAGGLCGVSGMLPDIDSDRGIPLRETMAFAAAVVPLLTVDRMQALGLSYESIVLLGAGMYLGIRFGLARLLAKYTVHRGMFHSIPAALVFGGLAFLLTGCNDLSIRYYKAGAVLLGYLSHLILDEIFSIEFSRGRFRLKRSSGTALKWWSKSLWANVSTYAKLILVAAAIAGEPAIMERFGTQPLIVIRKDWRGRVEERIAREESADPVAGDETIYDTARRLLEIWRH